MASLDDFKLPVFFCGPTLVGHHVDTTQTVLYARQNVVLGKGEHGQAYNYLETAQNECRGLPPIRAVKEISKAYTSTHGLDWQKEIRAVATLTSCKEKDLFQSFYGWYENAETVFLAMEYFPLGDLSEYTKDINQENEVVMIARQLVLALSVSHKHNIVHGDLNPKAVFVTASSPDWRVKVTGFGSPKHTHEKNGTLGYMAPEYRSSIKHNADNYEATPAADLWSVGCIIYELFTKHRFMPEEYEAFIRYLIDPSLPEPLTRSFASIDAQKKIQRFLDTQPETRITANDALSLFDDRQASTPSQPALDEPFEDLTIHQPAGQQMTSVSPSTLTPRPPPSINSLASSSVTLTNGEAEAMEPLVNVQSSFPPLSSAPSHPLPPARAECTPLPLPSPTIAESSRRSSNTAFSSLNTTYSKFSASSMPSLTEIRRKVESQVNASGITESKFGSKVWSMVNQSSAAQSTQNAGCDSGSQPQNLPPRPSSRRTMTETSQSSSVQVSDSMSDTSHSLQFVPVETNSVEIDRATTKWFIVQFEDKQWYMNFGLLTGREEKSEGCDLCEHTYRLTGDQRVVGNNFLHLCVSCENDRILCERCARDAVNIESDDHQADHTLKKVGPAFSYSFADLLSSSTFPIQPTKDTLTTSFRSQWLASNHGFRAPVFAPSKHLQVRFVLDPPPGRHQIAVRLRVVIMKESMNAALRMWMKQTGVALGQIAVGAQLLRASLNHSDLPPEQSMPDNSTDTNIVYEGNRVEYTMTTKLNRPIQTQDGDRLAMIIRSTYSPSAFKDGCPFVWYLNYIDLSQFGEEIQLATKGQLNRLERLATAERIEKRKQEKEEKDKALLAAGKQVGKFLAVVL